MRLETGDRRPETGDRRPETGDWRPETGDRRLETGDRRLETGDRRLETGGWRLETGDWRPETGDWRLETGDRRPEAGDRRPEAGDRRPEAGDRRLETGDRRPETGGWRPEAGGWRLEAGGGDSSYGLQPAASSLFPCGLHFAEPSINAAFDLPPEEALQFFRAKGLSASFDWRDMLHEAHDTAFTVAKMMELDLLADVKEAVDGAIASGKTFREFREGLEPLLQKRGWWGVKEMLDPLTGEVKTAQLGSPRRLETIFRANMRTAYAAGHWKQIEENAAAAPYLMYDAVDDGRTRPQHRAWDGLVLRHDDPWWETHYPPNGWNCRCGVIQLSGRQLAELGKSAPDSSPPSPTREWTNPRTGEILDVPEGIDPGWAYHPGKTSPALETARLFAEKLSSWPPSIAAMAAESMDDVILGAVTREFSSWVESIEARTLKEKAGRRIVAAMTAATLSGLENIGVIPRSAAITIDQREAAHLLAEARKPGKSLPVEMIRELPRIMPKRKAVIWDSQGRRPALLYVFDAPDDPKGRFAKIVIRVNYMEGGREINAIRSGGLVSIANLRQKGMILLEGELE